MFGLQKWYGLFVLLYSYGDEVTVNQLYIDT